MSRREFRATLEGPRAPAALAMVASATTTLAITGQMAPVALAVAALALGAAWLLRERPRAVQRSGLVLNAGLGLIAAAAVALWLRGALAVVALAHFALLTQSLQLLDARPRKSEFLLVALALFQVVLAANLTDSLLFPPLLVVFSVTTVWTLMVHTLRAEALEAGEPGAAQRALSGGLFTMTAVASLITVTIATAIFPILPRVRSGAFFAGGFGASLGVSGFSDRVELGDIGRIRLDPQVALRIETLSGDPPARELAYWRGLAFDRFDGHSWAVTPSGRERVPGFAEIGLAVGAHGPGPRLEQRIVREPVTSGVLFASGKSLTIRGPVGRVERDVNGALYAFSTAPQRIAYTVLTAVEAPDEEALRADRAAPPRDRGERYLAVPELSPEVRALAVRVTEGAASDAARVRAIEEHLRRSGRYTDAPPRHGAGASPIESFLLGRTEGHCEYFASGMVVLARSLGIAARLVNGFAGGEPNDLGGFVEVRQSDAHTWVEVHYARAGWVRYDPTPPDLRLAGSSLLSARDRLAALRSAAEYWWFKNVIDFDRERQAQALRRAWRAWHRWRAPETRSLAADPSGRRGIDLPIGGAAQLVLLCGLASLLGAAWLRHARRRRADPVPRYYREALRLLARGRGGTARGATTTARAFAAQARAALGPEAASAFAELTELYLRERFGGRAAGDAHAPALRALRDSLRP